MASKSIWYAMRNERFRPSKLALFVALAFASACGDAGITEPGSTEDVRPFVTGAASASVDAQGLFVFPTPVSPSALQILTPERARELAEAHVRTDGPNFEKDWEKERGAGIDLATLRADPRVLYVPTPFSLMPEGYHRSYTRELGPYYLVRMTSGREVVLYIAVAAYATEVAIDADGKTQRPALGRGGEFVVHPIARDTAQYRMFTPEQAAILAGRMTGVRVSEIPVLVQQQKPYSPTISLWRLTLERPVRVRAAQSARSLDVSEIYIDALRSSRLQIPVLNQPTSDTIFALRARPDGSLINSDPERLLIPILAGAPTHFEPVIVESR
ncbi:MAG TPA: hypothetical protein VF584_01785 [Longimicrobium sp.]|jgi:DNA-binding transcriptional MerR regulator